MYYTTLLPSDYTPAILALFLLFELTKLIPASRPLHLFSLCLFKMLVPFFQPGLTSNATCSERTSLTSFLCQHYFLLNNPFIFLS